MKIALLGYGKMGKAIEKIAAERGHVVSCRIGRQHAEMVSALDPSTVDVAIEFSHPQTAYHHIYSCLQKGIPVIAGTTGWLEKKPAIEAYCKQQNGTFFYANNFSLSAQIFFKMNILLAGYMQPYKAYTVTVSETHHVEKKDKPSGTALQLVADMLPYTDAAGWSLAEDPQPHTIPIIVHRQSDHVGTHVVTYSSSIESLSLQHTVWDRSSFVHGVIQVAEWLQGKKGVMNMDDFLSSSLHV